MEFINYLTSISLQPCKLNSVCKFDGKKHISHDLNPCSPLHKLNVFTSVTVCLSIASLKVSEIVTIAHIYKHVYSMLIWATALYRKIMRDAANPSAFRASIHCGMGLIIGSFSVSGSGNQGRKRTDPRPYCPRI